MPASVSLSLSGPRDRRRKRAFCAGASAFVASGATALVLLVATPTSGSPSFDRDATYFGRTTPLAFTSCADWPQLGDDDRRRAADHVLVNVRHALGDQDADDYSPPTDADRAAFEQIVDDGCALLDDPHALTVTAVAYRSYVRHANR